MRARFFLLRAACVMYAGWVMVLRVACVMYAGWVMVLRATCVGKKKKKLKKKYACGLGY